MYGSDLCNICSKCPGCKGDVCRFVLDRGKMSIEMFVPERLLDVLRDRVEYVPAKDVLLPLDLFMVSEDLFNRWLAELNQ